MTNIINKDFMKKLIDDFSSNSIIFENESQFQFDLAWAIRENISKENKSYKVLLERKINENANEYIDIVIENENNYIPIELKYKLADKRIEYELSDNKIVITSAQGAADNGCYDFWKDVKRIEDLIKNNDNVKKGFVIIMTNYPLYWGSGTKTGSNTDELCIRSVKSKSNYRALPSTKERNKEIVLDKEYSLDWNNYELNVTERMKGRVKHPFRYLIVELSKNKS